MGWLPEFQALIRPDLLDSHYVSYPTRHAHRHSELLRHIRLWSACAAQFPGRRTVLQDCRARPTGVRAARLSGNLTASYIAQSATEYRSLLGERHLFRQLLFSETTARTTTVPL